MLNVDRRHGDCEIGVTLNDLAHGGYGNRNGGEGAITNIGTELVIHFS